MPSINFFNAAIKVDLKKKHALRRWIEAAIKREGCSIRELNYILCSDKFLQRLNEKYLHHDDYTDIITFDFSSPDPRLAAADLQGEIFISITRVKENAKLFKTSFQNELHRVMIHGVLHLCGYKDKTKTQQTLIRKKENYYLNLRSF